MTSDANATTANSSTLSALYPFLHDKKTDEQTLHGALLDSVNHKLAHHQNVVADYFEKNSQTIVDCAKTIAQMYQRNGRLFTMGNGGSSSDASHIAVEFLHPVTTGRPALPAFDLSNDKTLISAIGNDVGFEHVYARQVENLMTENDLLIGISTSGNSANLLKAFSKAKAKGAYTVALLGGDGGDIAKLGLDHCLIVNTDSIHRTQECHVTTYHILWDLVHTLLADQRGNLSKTTSTNQGGK